MTTSTNKAIEGALKFSRLHRKQAVEKLHSFVRFPSVSVQSQHAQDVKNCGGWLAGQLQSIGMPRVFVVPTARHPIIYAERVVSKNAPTILIYGHYDVQPADPESAWTTPPFQPIVRDHYIYGRGASDDKGQLLTHVLALEAYLKTSRKLPVNVKCIFEGEEEIGSPNLEAFITRHRRRLLADAAVMSDTRMLGPDRPALTTSLRGALGFEIEVRGPRQDLHSGNFGGAVHNPLQALCEIIAKLHDENGRVTIPGFYDQVRSWDSDERMRMAKTGPSDSQIMDDGQFKMPWGETGFSLYERTTVRPALTVNGIVGGYQGPGGKAVIPSQAVAKISIRLVPDQNLSSIESSLISLIARLTPPTVRSRVIVLMRSEPASIERGHPTMEAAANAYHAGFGTAPVFVRSGGSIPVVAMFKRILGIPTVLMGFALPDDRIHAPNERFSLHNYFRGIDTNIHFLAEAGRVLRKRRAEKNGTHRKDR